jgi:hypothetical protein
MIFASHAISGFPLVEALQSHTGGQSADAKIPRIFLNVKRLLNLMVEFVISDLYSFFLLFL